VIDKDDQVRGHVEKNRDAFAKEDVETILALYLPGEKLAELVKEDAQRFRHAVNRLLGKRPDQLDDKLQPTEPTVALASQFEQEMDLSLAAAEAGVTPEGLLKGLDRSARLARSLGALKVKGNTVQREVFVAAFPAIVRTFDLGQFAGNVAASPASDRQINNSIGMKLALIPAGKFLMGVAKDVRTDMIHVREHEVILTKPYYMGVCEVTQEEYEKVMGKSPSKFSATGERKERVEGLNTCRFPVENITWDEAVELCEKLSELPDEKRQHCKYRLPTEAEWEHTCRGGAPPDKQTNFHYGMRINSRQENFNGELPGPFGEAGPNLKRPTTVGSYKPNAFGLYEMHGNVAEWCADYYPTEMELYGSAAAKKGPIVEKKYAQVSLPDRVIKGGDWMWGADFCLSGAHRAGQKNGITGLRVVCILEAP
jgi:formylglycine-generating enzyme required for sulfatase activity